MQPILDILKHTRSEWKVKEIKNSSESVVPKLAGHLRVCVSFSYFKERDKPFGGQSRVCKKVRTAKKLAYGQPRTIGFMMK